MAKRQIIVHVPANPLQDGVTVEVNGAIGSSCRKLTAGLEDALGKVMREEEKPEFSQESQTQQDELTQ